ncbi:hypothetical protein C2E23DRAFT_882257 [Lenzites betulinus]|nr:hypothetical protein C2E23DRAFT_882257 [Lenzites betulinus]
MTCGIRPRPHSALAGDSSSSIEEDLVTEEKDDDPDAITVVPSDSPHSTSPSPQVSPFAFASSLTSPLPPSSKRNIIPAYFKRPRCKSAANSPPSTSSPPRSPFSRLLRSTTELPAETAAHTVTIPRADITPLPVHRLGAPAAYDVDGRTPLYLGTAHAAFGGLHPCKIQPGALWPAALVVHAGREHSHGGRVDVLVVDVHAMEWVPARDGEVPRGRRPVVGGCEADGRVLFYAMAPVEKVWVPGKTGRHLAGACVPCGGKEHVVLEGYEIL